MKVADIRNISILGTGAMAPGIAQLCAQSGYNVSMWGRTDQSLHRGFNLLQANLQTCLENDLLRKGDEQLVLSRIKGVKSLEEAAKDAHFVIEAVAEDMVIKKDIFSRLDAVCPRESIFASNTSGLSITEIASATRRPDRVIVTHFWNPPHLIPLVEIVRGRKTAGKVAKVTTELMVIIGKAPVLVQKEVPGFIGNRLQFALLREALYLVEQGVASMKDVDNVVKWSFGRRLPITGPIESADLGGVDVFLAISEYLMKDLCRATDPSPLLVDCARKGCLGTKNGKGLYDWTPESIAEVQQVRGKGIIESLKKDKNLVPFKVVRETDIV